MNTLRDADKGAAWGAWLWMMGGNLTKFQAMLGGYFWKKPITLSFGGGNDG